MASEPELVKKTWLNCGPAWAQTFSAKSVAGVVVVPKRYAAEVAEKAKKRSADEGGKRKRLASGELGLDMYSMREALAKAGLVYVDNPEDV